MKQWLSLYDVPTEITTDHDPKFTSAWFNTLCPGLGISIAYTEVFRSQINSRAEVAGHQMSEILQKSHADSTPQGNDPSPVLQLPSVVRGYFKKPGNLGLGPHQILFGRDKIGSARCLPPTREAACTTQCLQEMRDMDRLVKSLQVQQLKACEVRYNKHHQGSTEYFLGNLVWVRMQRPPGTGPLEPSQIGLCDLISGKGGDIYIIGSDDHITHEKHVSELKIYKKPWLGPSVPVYWSMTLCEAKQPDPSMAYLLHKIRDHKVVRKNGVDKLYFLVNWQDYSKEVDTWESAELCFPGYNLPLVRYCIDKKVALDVKQLLPVTK